MIARLRIITHLCEIRRRRNGENTYNGILILFYQRVILILDDGNVSIAITIIATFFILLHLAISRALP